MGFSEGIIRWYHANRRLLPWRETRDPYQIWVSEVILQQTRVDQGLDYYKKFLAEFPDVKALAAAPLEKVLKAWQGLGYYSRARHMHEAARDIIDRYKASFPDSYAELLSLKGIGDYSASAIASIAFNEPTPVIDGNVMRVISRFMGIRQPVNTGGAKRRMKEILNDLIDRSNPGDFNQAVMELGALVCLPRNPRCHDCPLANECYAFRHDMISALPLREKARPKKVHYYHYLVFLSQQDGKWFTWLNKRTNDGIWKNLYDFPLLETPFEIGEDDLLTSPDIRKAVLEISGSFLPLGVESTRHVLSHKDLRVNFLILKAPFPLPAIYQKVALEDHHNYPVARPIENFLKKLMNGPGIFIKFPDKQ